MEDGESEAAGGPEESVISSLSLPHRARAKYHQVPQEDRLTHAGWIVWSTAAVCGGTIFLVLMLGILVLEVPWLGVFALVSLLPTLCILWLVYWRKFRDKAYLSRIAKFLVCGMIGVVPLYFIEELLDWSFGLLEMNVKELTPALIDVFFFSALRAFFVAALCEESFKYLLGYIITVRPGRDLPFSVVLYCMAGALGLATLENMMYVVLVGRAGNLLVTIITAVTRAFFAVPLHAATGVLIGCGITKKRFNVEQKNILKILLPPVLIHGFYDFFIMFPSTWRIVDPNVSGWIFSTVLISVGLVIFSIWLALKRSQSVLEIRNYIFLEPIEIV